MVRSEPKNATLEHLKAFPPSHSRWPAPTARHQVGSWTAQSPSPGGGTPSKCSSVKSQGGSLGREIEGLNWFELMTLRFLLGNLTHFCAKRRGEKNMNGYIREVLRRLRLQSVRNLSSGTPGVARRRLRRDGPRLRGLRASCRALQGAARRMCPSSAVGRE